MALSDEAYQLLREIQQNKKQKRNYVKVTVLLMLHLGNSLENISVSLGISTQTIQSYLQAYQTKGLDSYLENRYLGYSGKLSEEQKQVLKTELQANLYATSQEIAHFIHSNFGIRYTFTGLVSLLHKLGFSYKKPKLVPCEVNITAQKHNTGHASF